MPDIIQLRAETPACLGRIHLNNAGSSLTPQPVQDIIRGYYDLEADMGGYEAAAFRHDALSDFYAALATMLSTHPRNIAWANSATDAYARVLSAIDWQRGDIILTTNNDYASNQIAFFALRDRFGVQILRANDRQEGGVDPNHVAELVKKHQPRLVAVTHIPTNSGLVQPIATIGQICRATDTLYLVDACQSAGQIPLWVEQIGCDFLTATMRKYMRGPRGAGFLYVSDRVLDTNMSMSLPDMVSANWTGTNDWKNLPTAQRFEYFEYAPALKLGSAAAVRYYLNTGQAWIADRCCSLAAQLRTRLAQIPDVRVLDKGSDLCGIVTAWHPNFNGVSVMHWLREQKINTSVSTKPAAWIDFTQKGVDAALRLSVHYYNTTEELEQVAQQLEYYINQKYA